MLDWILGRAFCFLMLFERRESAKIPVAGRDLLPTRDTYDYWRETQG